MVREGSGEAKNISWTNVLTNKKFQSKKETLEIKYIEVGLDGIEKESQTITDTFHVVAAINIPVYSSSSSSSPSPAVHDPCFPMEFSPDPSSHALDVCFINSHGNVHDLLKKNILKPNDVANLNASMKAEMCQVRERELLLLLLF